MNHLSSSAVSEEEMTAAVTILTNRMNSFGESGATVQREGDNQILIQAPSAISQTARSTLMAPGKLEFVDLRDVADPEVVADIEANPTPTGITLGPGTYTAFMTGDSVARVDVEQASLGSAYFAVALELDSKGKSAFATVTSELVATNGRIAILLDGVVQCVPSVKAAITNGNVSITGNYTQDEAIALKTILDSSLLPEGLILSISSSAE